MKLFGALMIVFLVTGCALKKSKLSPLNTSTMIRSKQAGNTVLKVTSPITWFYSVPPNYEELCQLPTGTYVPEGKVGKYIYYRAPGPVSYTIKLSHYAQDKKKRKGDGGIYIRLGATRAGSKVGAYLKTETGVERVLEGFNTFFDEEGKTWALKEK